MPQGEIRTKLTSGEKGLLTRLPNVDQWLHDRVMETIAAQANASGYVAYTNRGGHHSVCLTGGAGSRGSREVCPDVILCNPESFLVGHAIEIEMENSINASTAQRWLDIARAIHGRGLFWIFAPSSQLALAAQLCQQHRIPVKIGTWSADSQGVLISWPTRLHTAPVR